MLRNVEFKKGAVVFFKGEPASVMYLIRSGRVTLRNDDSPFLRSRHELKAGDVLGAPEVLAGGLRIHTAYVEEDVMATELSKADLKSFLESNWDVGSKIVRSLSEELRGLDMIIQRQLGHLERGNSESLISIGEHFMVEGNLKAALQAFERCLEGAKSTAEKIAILRRLGELHERQGNFEEALRLFKQIAALAPQDEAIQKEVQKLESFVSSFGRSQ